MKIDDKLMILAIQIIMTYTWVLSGWPKLTDSAYRENFEKRFNESFLATLPGGISHLDQTRLSYKRF